MFSDNGVSGAYLERPALDLLRDRAAAGQVEKVIVHSPDRLARKYAHQLLLVEEFQKLGVEIVFVNRNISSTPEDQLLLQIQGVVSEYEREKILERNRRGKLHKAKQGKVSALVAAPYGYLYVRKHDREDARYEINSDEAAIVRRVFDMYCRERMTLYARSAPKTAIPKSISLSCLDSGFQMMLLGLTSLWMTLWLCTPLIALAIFSPTSSRSATVRGPLCNTSRSELAPIS